jgi:serine/threonine protein kinase
MRDIAGRYRITGILGEGGMGVVHAAFDERLGRAVAIKTLRAPATDAIARERLQREARAAARVNHPNICQLYELGDDEGELFRIVHVFELTEQGQPAGGRARAVDARRGACVAGPAR